MVELVATTALETLRDLLVEETRFLAGVGGRVEDVRRQLNRMHCILQDTDRRDGRLSSHLAQQCLAELGDLAIEAEQVLEIYAVKVMSRREGKGLMNSLNRCACILCECWSLHHTGNRAENIMRRMEDLTRRVDGMAPGESSSDVVEWSRKTYGNEVEENFVGMKDDMEHLKSLVTSDERSSRVISICGMGGLGKTTLATKIYQSNTVQPCFEVKAWICVSQPFRPEVIFQQLLKQLLPNANAGNMSGDELVRQLNNVQKERKCLVVLDDVWEAEHWNILSPAFPITESSCKVLITSRNEKVAGTEYVHKLQHLSEDEGWEILRRIALPISRSQELNTTHVQRMEKVGREIVWKCARLPLAISVIGGILRREKDLIGWEKVRTSVDSYLQHGRGNEQGESVTRVLEMSYDALPYNLKPCFLYLGCFHEDQEIDVEQLYSIWMAEGLISLEEKGRRETLRDVAERYLDELASRCMVQVELHDIPTTYKRFSSCRIHDLVRDCCLLKVKAEGFLKVVNKEGGADGSMITGVPRLVVYWDGGRDYKWRNPHLRALIIRKGERVIMENLKMFKYLKILVLEDLDFENGKLPKGINKLVLLKHLRIYRCKLDTLPRAVCELPHLQSMHLEDFEYLRIPNLVHRLRQLTYLDFNKCGRSIIGGKKLKLGGLNKLETLIGFNSKHDDVMDLISLEKLRILNAKVLDEKSCCTIVDHIFSQQDQFCNINLNIECNFNSDIEGFPQMNLDLLNKIFHCKPIRLLYIYGFRFRNLPMYTPEFGQNMVHISLNGCEMVEDPMETFGKLPMLQRLSLWNNSFVGTKMICRADGFPQLKYLALKNLSHLVNWRLEKEAMPHLSSLTIWSCEKLEMIPDGLKFITSIRKLSVYDMPEGFKKRVGEGGEDYDKIKHVPTVTVFSIDD